ncbi:hypothetical protein C4D60_Mb04t08230 [Musa balbisiana]|uniref:Uncharacterized protein n=1 Tax=Musa balbisiana TaxID=52838 RepID=A0A4S8KAH3_MUSBA|nr:hypothetical protein C4D60_Mb04t08230 [Musa balbisiana]
MPECRTSKEMPCHDTAKLGTSSAQRCNSATLSEWTTSNGPVSPPPRSGGRSPDDGAEVKTCTRWPRRASALWKMSAWRSMKTCTQWPPATCGRRRRLSGRSAAVGRA